MKIKIELEPAKFNKVKIAKCSFEIVVASHYPNPPDQLSICAVSNEQLVFLSTLFKAEQLRDVLHDGFEVSNEPDALALAELLLVHGHAIKL